MCQLSVHWEHFTAAADEVGGLSEALKSGGKHKTEYSGDKKIATMAMLS